MAAFNDFDHICRDILIRAGRERNFKIKQELENIAEYTAQLGDLLNILQDQAKKGSDRFSLNHRFSR